MKRAGLLALLALALLPATAHALLPPQFGPEPAKCQPAGCYSTGPGIMDNTFVAEVTTAPKLIRAGEDYTVEVVSLQEGTTWSLPTCGANAPTCTYTPGVGGGSWQQFTVNFGAIQGPAIEEDYFGVIPPNTYAITGTVRRVDLHNPGSYVPAEGVNVYVSRTDNTEVTGRLTNADGNFTILVYAGEYRVGTVGGYCVAPAGNDCVQSKVVTTGPDQTVNFDERDSVEVKGRVTEGADHRGVHGVDVSTPAGSTTTLKDGSYSLRVPRGSTPVRLKAGVTGEVYRPVQGAADCQVVSDGCNVFPSQDRKVDFHKAGSPRYRWSVTDECTSQQQGCDGSRRLKIAFDGSQSEVEPDRTIAKYEWDVGGRKLEGKLISVDLASADSLQVELTTVDDQGKRTALKRAVQDCDGDSADPAVGVVATRPAIGPCFPLRMRLLGDKIGEDTVKVTMVVDNDGAEPLTDLTYSGGTGLTLDKGQEIVYQAFGPSHEPPTRLEPKAKDELEFQFVARKDGTLRIVGAVSARTPSGREMTASSVLVIKIREVGLSETADETRIGGHVIARHIEKARRSGDAGQTQLGREIARRASPDGKVHQSDQEQLMAELIGSADGTLAWVDEAGGWRGPDDRPLGAADVFQTYLAAITSKEGAAAGVTGVRNAIKDAVSAPNDILELTAGPELKALQRLGGLMMNITDRDGWQYMGDELMSLHREYGSDKLAQGDIFGVKRGFADVLSGTKTLEGGLASIDTTTRANAAKTEKTIDSAFRLARRGSAALVRGAQDDPIGATREAAIKGEELKAYVGATILIDVVSGKALAEIARANKLPAAAAKFERATGEVAEDLNTIGDATRHGDLVVATDIPRLDTAAGKNLKGAEALGYGPEQATALEATRAATEQAIGSAARGKRLVFQFRAANDIGFLRFLQGITSPKPGAVANKTGKVIDQVVAGMSSDALGLANFTRPREPTGLAKIVRSILPESQKHFERRALKYAEYDEFFNPGKVTKTGNAKRDAAIRSERADLQTKMGKLRQATSAEGLRDVDGFGNVVELKLNLERTADGRSVVMRVVEHKLNGKVVGKPGKFVGLDYDGLGMHEVDLTTGIADALPAAAKGSAFRTATEQGRKLGLPFSDTSLFSRDSIDLAGPKGAKVSALYSFEGGVEAARRYIKENKSRLIKRLFFEKEDYRLSEKAQKELIKKLEPNFDEWSEKPGFKQLIVEVNGGTELKVTNSFVPLR